MRMRMRRRQDCAKVKLKSRRIGHLSKHASWLGQSAAVGCSEHVPTHWHWYSHHQLPLTSATPVEERPAVASLLQEAARQNLSREIWFLPSSVFSGVFPLQPKLGWGGASGLHKTLTCRANQELHPRCRLVGPSSLRLGLVTRTLCAWLKLAINTRTQPRPPQHPPT